MSLLRRYDTDGDTYEISIDEAGRGCLFGRVYIAAVVLPKDPEAFSGAGIKDSKKFSSKKKLGEVADYIQQNALVWHVAYVEADVIDEINILQAVMRGMHECIRESLSKLGAGAGAGVGLMDCAAIVDGNYFTPYRVFDEGAGEIREMPWTTVEQGDAKYMAIAAASILAKHARDEYVAGMCAEHPDLAARYGLDTNMGYGTKTHLAGIGQHGISQWHRRTFGAACKSAVVNPCS
jgi:ribonuclease HII